MTEHCTGPGSDNATPAKSPLLYAAPTANSPPMRITMVLPGRIPGWLSTFIGLLAINDWVELTIIVADSAVPPRTPEFPAGVRAYLALERMRQRGSTHALSAVPIPSCKGVNVLASTRPSELLARMEAEIERRPDLVLSLASREWSEPWSRCARWGCWTIGPDLVDPDHAGASLLVPIALNEPATAIELELDVGVDAAVLPLVASWGATQRDSFIQQREQAFLKLPALLVRALHRLACGLLEPPGKTTAMLRLGTARPLHGGMMVLRAMAATSLGAVQWQLRKRRRWLPWMVVLRGDAVPIDPHAARIGAYTAIQAPHGVCWADPCLVEASGRRLLFVEELAGRKAGGAIACVELDNGNARRLGLALRENIHLSYPQVFEWQGHWYLTVESSQARRVSLYRATAFPMGWQRVDDLVTGWTCVDPTLHYHDGHWYLFANIAECGNSTWDELFLFVADQLAGPYRPHPANPIVSDVRHARPAGRLFFHGGSLIRPSQDCAAGYGAGLVFNEVVELSPTGYRERSLSRLAADWAPGLEACHTYSAAGGLEIVDARGIPAPDAAVLHVTASPARAAVA